MKKTLRITVIVLAVLLLAAGGYVSYVLLSFHRLGDGALTVQGPAPAALPETERAYTVVSYNIGFGAYEADFGFFMDGGKQSRAWSGERLDANLTRIGGLLREQSADLYLIQEVDIDSTRSYRRDERANLISALPELAFVFCQNYDSPYLFYPLLRPHGASKSGLMTFSAFPIGEAERLELPIESGLRKLLDLDRCYSKSRVALPGRQDLVLYDFHLSAYTADGSISTEQLRQLLADMEGEYARHNYCVAGAISTRTCWGIPPPCSACRPTAPSGRSPSRRISSTASISPWSRLWTGKGPSPAAATRTGLIIRGRWC